MSGIAFVADAEAADASIGRMVCRDDGRVTQVEAPSRDIRIAGWGRRSGRPGPTPQCFRDHLWVVVEGEIYGEEDKDRGPVVTPAAPIADALLRDRPEDIYRLNGTFAAIAWDGRANRLHLIADRLSTRLLYFWSDGVRIAAASRLHALLGDQRVPRRLDRAGVLETLVHQRPFAHRTICEGVEGLSCGEMVTIERGRARRRQIWRPAWTGGLADRKAISRELADVTRKAVRRRIPASGGRPGLLLSGGLDSRMVLAAAGQDAPRIHCATVSAWENVETRTARSVAAAAGAPFTLLESDPARFHERLPEASRLVDGMLPAPLSLPGSYGDVSAKMDAAFSGHFLDVLFRGTYQPKAYMNLIRGRAALPKHRPIADAAPETISREHHIQTELRAHTSVLSDAGRQEWEEAAVEGLRTALALADFENRYDAFDVFCLHAQGRHHSNTDFLSLSPWAEYRVPAFDRDLFDLYLRIPAALRVGQATALRAMGLLSSRLFSLPDAGTGRRGTTGPRTRIFWALWNAAARRARLSRPRVGPQPWLTEGSWVNWPIWFRQEPNIRRMAESLPESQALMDTGLFDRAGLRAAINGHMSGGPKITKLLHRLLTLDAWLLQYPVK